MILPILNYSKSQVNKAGEILTKEDYSFQEMLWAFEVVNNWRSCHAYPINTFQATLRKKLNSIDTNSLVAQRLKRMPSIIGKLKRFDSMQLSRMQDLGGLRAVVSNIKKVRELEMNYKKNRFKHRLVSTKDYISFPKKSGYRGVHLVYKYENDSAPQYNGLYIELQIRSKLQHIWATAVETIGTFLDYALKASDGPGEWLNFFSLAGSAFAHLENTCPVPGYETKSRENTFKETLSEAKRLCIYEQLKAFSIAAEKIYMDKKIGSYHIIILDLEKKIVAVRSYPQKHLELANKEYAKFEKRISMGEKLQVVLVSAGHIENLRRAYPNYFLDAREFISQLKRIDKLIS